MFFVVIVIIAKYTKFEKKIETQSEPAREQQQQQQKTNK